MRMKPEPKTQEGKILQRAAATWMSKSAVLHQQTIDNTSAVKVSGDNFQYINMNGEITPNKIVSGLIGSYSLMSHCVARGWTILTPFMEGLWLNFHNNCKLVQTSSPSYHCGYMYII